MISINLLPRGRRRVAEPTYWRLIAIVVPIAVLSIIGALQYLAMLEQQAAAIEVRTLEAQAVVLQPAIDELAQAEARRRELESLAERARLIREGSLSWTRQIEALLMTLPRGEVAGTTLIDFRTLALRTLTPPISDPTRYEGATAYAEATITGEVANLDVLSAFLGNLEQAAAFGASFRSTSQQQDGDGAAARYAYNLSVGVLEPFPPLEGAPR